MARKPQVTSSKRTGAAARPAKSPATAARPAGGEAALRRELAAARTRIAELEKNQGEISRRVEAAIAAIQKLLEI